MEDSISSRSPRKWFVKPTRTTSRTSNSLEIINKMRIISLKKLSKISIARSKMMKRKKTRCKT